MNFTFAAAIAFLLSPLVYAQTATVVADSKFFCKVEEFAAKKAVAKAFKRCDAMVEGADQPTKNAEDCKEHALAKGRECLKASGAEKITVKVKFTEKFGNNHNFNTWTCELDNKGGSACP